MAPFSSITERKTPRFRCRFVRVANRPSTALIQDALIGVKWRWKRGCRTVSRQMHCPCSDAVLLAWQAAPASGLGDSFEEGGPRGVLAVPRAFSAAKPLLRSLQAPRDVLPIAWRGHLA